MELYYSSLIICYSTLVGGKVSAATAGGELEGLKAASPGESAA